MTCALLTISMFLPAVSILAGLKMLFSGDNTKMCIE